MGFELIISLLSLLFSFVSFLVLVVHFVSNYKYNSYLVRDCRIERFYSFEKIPTEYLKSEGGSDPFFAGGYQYPEFEYDMPQNTQYVVITPNKGHKLKNFRISMLNVESVGNMPEYDLVKEWKGIDKSICIVADWNDALSYYKVTWDDVYGKHTFWSSEKMEIEDVPTIRTIFDR